MLFSEHVAKGETAAPRRPFDLHLLLFNFAISSWRPYLVHLAEEIHQHANTVLLAAPTGKGPVSFSGCGDLQRLKQLGDEMLDIKVALSTTRDAVSRLTEGHTHHVTKNDVPDQTAIEADEDEIRHQLMEHLRELEWLLQQTDGMHQKLLGTSQLVSSFMALGNGLSMEDLGNKARDENSQIHKLTKQSTKDAAAVKVLTIIMLVYLHATVVSNFFSTSFVDKSSSTGSPTKLIVLSNWWIFVVISVPLTFVTLYIWWFFKGLQAGWTYPQWWKKLAELKLVPKQKRALPTDEEKSIEPSSTTATTSTLEIDAEKLSRSENFS